jgi:putative membrane protein
LIKKDKKLLNIKAVATAGIAAGLISGLVKIGWENILPPRTPERDATNPPQKLLEQLGFSASTTHATYRYAGHDLPWVSYLVHFGFSTTFAAVYQILSQYEPKIKAGGGSVFGLAVWAAFHLGIMPAMKTVPAAKDQPVEEHVSEALGHVVWMWTNDTVGTTVYRRLADPKK